MIKFKEYFFEEDHYHMAQTALMAGDYETAHKHLKQHVQGKSLRRDAEVAKLRHSIRNKLKEENTQGDIGTDKLTNTRKKLTPGEKMVTPEPLKDFETFEPISTTNK
jgi:hypothetical protein